MVGEKERVRAIETCALMDRDAREKRERRCCRGRARGQREDVWIERRYAMMCEAKELPDEDVDS